MDFDRYLVDLYAASPAGMIVWRLDGVILAVNPAFCALLGIDRDTLLTRNYWTLAAVGQKQRELNDIVSVGKAFTKEFIDVHGSGVLVQMVGYTMPKSERASGEPGPNVSPSTSLDASHEPVFAAIVHRYDDLLLDRSPNSAQVLQKQNVILLNLTKSTDLDGGDLDAALRVVTEAAAAGMSCARASIWLYDEGHTKITCIDLFEREAKAHSKGVELGRATFPRYFEAMAEDRQIVANDAHTHPGTSEFSQSYLMPLGINSMLDAPIRHRGRTVGVLCHEHVGPMRAWSPEEQSFAASLADVFARSLEARARLRAEDALQKANAELEERVSKRTAELDAAMKELWGEMQLAQRIQTALLPESPKHRGAEVLGYSKPADQVGGDFYDFIQTGDSDWIVIGDVSGHGVPAGLVMMMCQTAIRAVLSVKPDSTPSELLIAVNRVLRHNIERLGDDRYVSICILRRDTSGTYQHVGQHVDPLIFRRATGEVESIETSGVFLGIADDIHDFVDVGTFSLATGDVLLLCTDGLTEAERSGRMIELEGVAEELRHRGRQALPDIATGTTGLLTGCTVADDVTFVIVRPRTEEKSNVMA